MHWAIFSLCACHRNIYFFLEKEAIVSTGRQNIAKLHQRGLLLSLIHIYYDDPEDDGPPWDEDDTESEDNE